MLSEKEGYIRVIRGMVLLYVCSQFDNNYVGLCACPLSAQFLVYSPIDGRAFEADPYGEMAPSR
jgi:hypothetical protein